MKKWMMVLALIAGSVCFAGSVAAEVSTADNGQVCSGLDSGVKNVSQQSVTITADPGYLIDSYCVKAGSANQGDGPVYVNVNPPRESVTFTYPGGKDISHYSYSQVRERTTTQDKPKDDKPKDDTKKPADETPATGETANETVSLPASGA